MRRQRLEDVFTKQRIDRIYGIFRSRLSSEQRAWDATHDLFLVAIENYERFDPRKGRLDAWLNGFVVIFLMRERQRAARERHRNVPFLDEYPARPGQVEPSGLSPTLKRAMAKIPERDRALFFRFVALDQSIDQLATAFGMSQSAVTTALARARDRLRAHMTEDEDPIGDHRPEEDPVSPPPAGR